jgi:hypothetical protein
MLTLSGKGERFCDGVSRRSFLGAGLLSLSGLTLADMLRGRAAGNTGSAVGTSVIFVELAGGPPNSKRTIPSRQRPASTAALSKPFTWFGRRRGRVYAQGVGFGNRLARSRCLRHRP